MRKDDLLLFKFKKATVSKKKDFISGSSNLMKDHKQKAKDMATQGLGPYHENHGDSHIDEIDKFPDYVYRLKS